ncbi:MAG: hypothetical protein R2746_09940 [Acidimicrobiales bacterium]
MTPGIALADATGAPWLNVWLVAAAVGLMVVVGLPAMAAGVPPAWPWAAPPSSPRPAPREGRRPPPPLPRP